VHVVAVMAHGMSDQLSWPLVRTDIPNYVPYTQNLTLTALVQGSLRLL